MEQRVYQVKGMDCAGCAREIEDGLRRLDGVDSATVDYMSCTLKLTGRAPFEDLQTRVQALGKSLVAPDEARPVKLDPARGGVLGFAAYLLSRDETRSALTGAFMVLVALVLSLMTSDPLIDFLIVGGMIFAAIPIARSGLNALWINRRFNINMLMTIAAVGAVVIGEYLEGAVVVILFSIGEALEGYTADRARSSIRSLLLLKPARANRVHGDHEHEIAADLLEIGDHVLVRPGEVIPADGTIAHGSSGINQAPVTGESVPVYKTEGDLVFAGTLNGDGMLRVHVTRTAADNTISRIIQLVEEAQSVRAPSQRMIDRFAAWYTPAVTVLALIVAVLPPLLFNAPFYDTAEGHGWLYRALALLVIACPCALVISTPVTVISAMTAAARRGILIKGGAFLEALGSLKALAFDKTGTLTTGRPQVYAIRGAVTEAGDQYDSDDVLALAAALEKRTGHPLAKAVVDEAKSKQLDSKYPAAEGVELIPGRGVRGVVAGRPVTIGSHAYFEEQHPHGTVLCEWAKGQEEIGHATMMVADGQQVIGALALGDTLRPEVPHLNVELASMGVHLAMLTGDHRKAAEAFAARSRIVTVRSELLPGQKVDALRELAAQHGAIGMVGDGINDAPALAAASVGIAMGGAGSPQALETADVALMADDLSGLPFAIRLSRFARSIIRQNIVLSFGLKAAFVVLALEGAASLWLAVAADVGMALLVTLNGMRPLRWGDK